jgi:hypothetical protein
MSEKLIRFLLSELKTVRVLCQHPNCNTVVEVSVEDLPTKYQGAICPLCRNTIQAPQYNNLVTLGTALRGLASSEDRVKVEFVIPDKS